MSGPLYEYCLFDGDRKCIIVSPWDDTSAIDLRIKAEQMGFIDNAFKWDVYDEHGRRFCPTTPVAPGNYVMSLRQRPDPPIVPFDMEIAGMKITILK